MGAEVTAVALVSPGLVIGSDGCLPWLKPLRGVDLILDELEGSPVVVGRNARPAAKELGYSEAAEPEIVVSTSEWFRGDGVRTARSPGSALSLALSEADEMYVAGGESMYRALGAFCTRLLLLEVPGEVDGDASFPRELLRGWDETSRRDVGHGFTLVEHGDEPHPAAE